VSGGQKTIKQPAWRDHAIMKAAKIKRLMRISALGAGGRGNLETAGLREAFLSHLGFQSLRVIPSGRGTI